jgi:hypothetical protein
MSLMSEYINKRYSTADLEKELINLIKKYNNIKKTYMFIYSVCMNKQIPLAQIEQSDYYIPQPPAATKMPTAARSQESGVRIQNTEFRTKNTYNKLSY